MDLSFFFLCINLNEMHTLSSLTAVSLLLLLNWHFFQMHGDDWVMPDAGFKNYV